MRSAVIRIIAICLVMAASARAEGPGIGERPVPAIQRAVVISIDGLRPDVALRAKMPNLRHLYETGSFTFWARTTALSITLPSHTSMLTGVTPERHGITWNSDLKFAEPVYPNAATLFQVAKKAGYTTAMAAGKSKFAILNRPGTIDWVSIAPTVTSEDEEVTAHAVEMIRDHQPQVLFIHLPSADGVGHAIGWGTPDQIAAVERADACIGQVLAALDEQKLTGSTFILLTADHGGAGRNHGPDDPRSRHIPWIANGPGIRKNLDLTTSAALTINTEDTFATVCALLAIPHAKGIDGKPILEIIDRKELLQLDQAPAPDIKK